MSTRRLNNTLTLFRKASELTTGCSVLIDLHDEYKDSASASEFSNVSISFIAFPTDFVHASQSIHRHCEEVPSYV